MTLTVTHPGRYGDLLWACPTIRALAAVHGPVHLHLPGEFQSIVPLLVPQPYIEVVTWDPNWAASPETREAPMYPEGLHLGYQGWPEVGLPYQTYQLACSLTSMRPLDLETPWITVPGPAPSVPWTVGFTDTWFELKWGLLNLLDDGNRPLWTWVGANTRWCTEGKFLPTPWTTAARYIASSRVLLTDCSALHVLAVALGVPCVVVEPMEARWNPIFWPLGMDGPRVTCVKGQDGRPTFDARHVRDALEVALGR